MEFVFDPDIKREVPPKTPDFLNSASRDFGESEDIFSTAPSVKPRKKLNRRSNNRKLPESFSDIQFNEPMRKTRARTTGPKVNYVKPVKKPRRKKTGKFQWTWAKFGWAFCALLVLRLVFMESGLLDYHSMHQALERKERDLVLLRSDNAELIEEINKIKTSHSYQKKLARDHLGVITNDEYLILFSRESELSSSI